MPPEAEGVHSETPSGRVIPWPKGDALDIPGGRVAPLVRRRRFALSPRVAARLDLIAKLIGVPLIAFLLGWFFFQ